MRVLIVEDEVHTAALLREIIEQSGAYTVTAQLESVADTISFLRHHQQETDLIFMDIQLADGPSFELFRHIDVTVPIVFCTAYDEFSLQAIKNNGIDYILKPFKEAEIHAALQKYEKWVGHLQHRAVLPEGTETGYQQNFLSQFRDKVIIIPASSAALFYRAHETLHVYTFDGAQYPLFKNLEYIESVCDPVQFFRINRQMLVNKAAVQAIEPYFHRKIALQLKIAVPDRPIVSRLKVSAFKDWLERG